MKLVDTDCHRLAERFILSERATSPRTSAKLAADTQSLAEAIQGAIEDWFEANPVETQQTGEQR